MRSVLPRGSRVFATGTVFLVAAAYLVIQALGTARTERSLAGLSLVTSLKSSSALEELEEARSDAILWSGFGGIVQRLIDLENAWVAMGPDAGSVLERIYVLENPFPETERSRLSDPKDGSPYPEVHADIPGRVQGIL